MDKMNANVFLTVAQEGSFRKAADALGYTQAGISYIISTMEELTGLCLFIREHGGVRLSTEGAALLPLFRQLNRCEQQLKQAIDELNGLEKGIVRVQIFDSISIHWIPNIIKEFHADYPHIQIELITEEDSLRAEEMVLNGEVDCGFFLTEVSAKLDVFPLVEESLKAIVSLEHPLAQETCFPMKELGNYPYISMKYDDNTGIRGIFQKRGVTPDTAFCMDNDYAAMAMVSKNLGYCIFPELLLQDIPYELHCMEFDEPQKRTISIGTRSMETCSMACRKFIAYTRRWVEENT
ncbi:MAG: LysR family transcriptional regulator [Butyricicoccus sp.]|nr:LysR family transcriptional regulator [Butyricicoccus sp.]